EGAPGREVFMVLVLLVDGQLIDGADPALVLQAVGVGGERGLLPARVQFNDRRGVVGGLVDGPFDAAVGGEDGFGAVGLWTAGGQQASGEQQRGDRSRGGPHETPPETATAETRRELHGSVTFQLNELSTPCPGAAGGAQPPSQGLPGRPGAVS